MRAPFFLKKTNRRPKPSPPEEARPKIEMDAVLRTAYEANQQRLSSFRSRVDFVENQEHKYL